MSNPASETTTQWAAEWLDAVANGSNTMSQRKRSSIETRGGGLDAVKALAEQKGVHLLLLEDDKGDELVAASTNLKGRSVGRRRQPPCGRKKRQAKEHHAILTSLPGRRPVGQRPIRPAL